MIPLGRALRAHAPRARFARPAYTSRAPFARLRARFAQASRASRGLRAGCGVHAKPVSGRAGEQPSKKASDYTRDTAEEASNL